MFKEDFGELLDVNTKLLDVNLGFVIMGQCERGVVVEGNLDRTLNGLLVTIRRMPVRLSTVDAAVIEDCGHRLEPVLDLPELIDGAYIAEVVAFRVNEEPTLARLAVTKSDGNGLGGLLNVSEGNGNTIAVLIDDA